MNQIILMPSKISKKQNVTEKVAEKVTKKTISKPVKKSDKTSVRYWNAQPATINGVLGGYGELDQADIHTSGNVLRRFKGAMVGAKFAIDIGAGIGRISKHLLCK